jgi:hypothetical protein
MHNKDSVRVRADADLVIFDPARAIDRSAYQQHSLAPDRIAHVIVGRVEIVSGAHVVDGVTAGRAVRPPVR